MIFDWKSIVFRIASWQSSFSFWSSHWQSPRCFRFRNVEYSTRYSSRCCLRSDGEIPRLSTVLPVTWRPGKLGGGALRRGNAYFPYEFGTLAFSPPNWPGRHVKFCNHFPVANDPSTRPDFDLKPCKSFSRTPTLCLMIIVNNDPYQRLAIWVSKLNFPWWIELLLNLRGVDETLRPHFQYKYCMKILWTMGIFI